MSAPYYAKAISAEGIRLFLAIMPSIFSEAQGAYDILAQDRAKYLAYPDLEISWCLLYELPIKK